MGHIGKDRHAELALLGGEVGGMIAPDAVLVADRSAVIDDDSARRVLELLPAGERLVRIRSAAEDVRRVEARATRIDVGKVAERVDALADVARRLDPDGIMNPGVLLGGEP